jgi:hypothetical protein
MATGSSCNMRGVVSYKEGLRLRSIQNETVLRAESRSKFFKWGNRQNGKIRRRSVLFAVSSDSND